MKVMRKIQIGLIAILALTFALTAYGAEGVIYFSDPESTQGSTVSVQMTIQAEGAEIGDATVTLRYPSDNLVFISGDQASGGAGTLRIHGITEGASAGKCTYQLKFQTPNPGSFTINIDTYEVYDASGSAVEITHAGSSGINVTASEGVSSDSSLSVLTVSPGELMPEFSPDIYEYQVRAGLSVDSLVINALGTESDAKVSITGNADLKEGENKVTVFVTAPDGVSQAEYQITVTKEEGGAENETSVPETEAEDFADDVQLFSKGKSITIMTPDENTVIPEGFKESAISIDGQKVQGWIWGAEGTPQYCVVYGMNEQGEINFYRYDMNEKTIQRYFEDPLAADCVTMAEYNELEAAVGALKEEIEGKKLMNIILGIVLLFMLFLVVYLIIKISQVQRRSKEDVLEDPQENTGNETEYQDETRVIVRNERRKRVREHTEDETIVIKKTERNEERVPETEDPEDDGFEDLDF